MEKRKKLRRLLVTALVAVTTVAPPLLYSFLVHRDLEGVYMYGGDSFFWVGAVSVLGAAGIMIALREREKEQTEEPETAEEESFEYFEEATVVDTSTAREEYPELFSEKKKENEEDEPAEYRPSYHEALAAALNAQKAVYTDPETKEPEVDDTEDFFYEKKEEETAAFKWSDLPDTLPEGYMAYEEETEPEEELDDEPETDSQKSKVKGASALRKVLIVLLLIAVPFGFSAFMSHFRTDYHSEGVTVKTPSREREYTWTDCESFEIGPSFFGDGISFVLYMENGAEIELLPSDMQIVGDDFGDPYAYAVYVEEGLCSANAEKRIRERNTLESDLALREDIGEYVRKLIE